MLALPILAPIRPQPVLWRRLTPPRGLAGVIERGTLLARVKGGLKGQVVIVQAPPGFGKTELLLAAFQKLPDAGDRFVWMSLDPSDSDPHVFWRDLAHALGGESSFGWRSVEPMDSEALLRAALAAIPAEPGKLVIFLDDFHVANGAGFKDSFAQWLRRLPDNVSVIISTRRRADIPLARLRMRNLLTEIHAEDLAFSRREVACLLGPAATADETAKVHEITGGWPAIVQLAVPVLHGRGDAPSRAEALAGAHATFSEFLDEEFLPGLPAELGAILQDCSLLDEFSLELAASLAGLDSERTHVFDFKDVTPIVKPVAERPGWWRLNPILRSLLRARSNSRDPGAVADLHIRAARWFGNRGILDKAVHHAAQGRDYAMAAELIGRAGGVNIYLRMGFKVLARLLADLPPAIVERSPALMLCHAVSLSKRGQIQASRAVLDELKNIDAKSVELVSSVSVFKTDLDHIDALVECYEDKRLDEGRIAQLERDANDHRLLDRWRRGWTYNHLCLAYQRIGDLLLARRAGLRALACYREQKSPYAQVFMLAHLGMVLMLGGRLAAAVKILRGADRLVQETQWTDQNLAAVVHIPLATSLYLQGDAVEAERLLTIAMPIVSAGEGWVDVFACGFGALARARFQLHGFEAGLAVLDQAEELAVERDLPRLTLSIAVARVELLTRAGLLESARDQWQRLPPVSLGASGWSTWRERQDARIAQARLHLLSGQPALALEVLDAFIAEAREREAGYDILNGEIKLTEALWALDRFDESLASLQRAIALARPQDFVQPFLDAGPAYSKVVRAITRRFGLSLFSADSATFIVRINGLGPKPRASTASGEGKILSIREIEVLSCVERDLSNKEIARKLELSEVTVKFHLKNLFKKLGVSRRNLALGVARAAGLL